MSAPNLRIPGPTPLPPVVLKAIGRQMINHRGGEYKELQKKVTANLQHFFQTTGDVFLYTSSGTGALEAAIVNFFSPGDTILSFTCGIFGERWADAARAYGLRVIQKKFPYGQPVDVSVVEETLREEPNAAGVFVTHNETSTGVLNSVKEIADTIRKRHQPLSLRAKGEACLRRQAISINKDRHASLVMTRKPLLLVDAVSSLGAVNLPMDDWGIDVVATASQKAWMAPPGLAMLSVSEYAWQKHKTASLPRYYFDISKMKEYSAKGQTPATPALTTLYGLDAALDLMISEGREAIFSRHLSLRDQFRRQVCALGLDLLVADACASPTVTSIVVPQGVDAHRWLEALEQKHGIVVGGGLGELKGKIIRVAHMGWVGEADMKAVIQAFGAIVY